MYIEDKDSMTVLVSCFEDIEHNWGNLSRLTRSIGWHRNDALSDREIGKNVYDYRMGDNGTLRVHELDGDVQITLEA